MSSLSRKKSVKNIILKMQNQRKQLLIEQLKTEPPLTRKLQIKFEKIYDKYGTQQQQNIIYNKIINNMARRYYDANLIKLDNEIFSNQKKQYLKRFYYEWEYQQKVTMLGEYYKFHFDQPRFFHKELHQIISLYQQDKRQLEYQNVKEKIQQQKQKNINVQEEKHINKVKSNTNISKAEQKNPKCQFILQDILKMYDYESTKNQKPKQNSKSHYNQGQLINVNKQKLLHQTKSLNSKKMVSSKSQHHKCKDPLKIQNKIITIKNAQKKQLHNLQSKYTQIISEMFKKKRSSAKIGSQWKKKQQKVIEKFNKIIDNKNRAISNRQDKHSLEKCKNQNENCKIARSKSQSHINFIQMHPFLKPYEKKMPSQRFISVKPIKLETVKYQKKNKNLTTTKSSKENKNSTTNRSKKDKQSSIISRQDKTVRVFEITKKDLIQDQFRIKSPQIYSREQDIKEGKQNKQNEELNRQQCNQQGLKQKKRDISLQAVTKKLAKCMPSEKNIKVVKKEQKVSSMFSRVIKNKIRN